jgi:organic hydroperoxide reductase OsmC/OhrA
MMGTFAAVLAKKRIPTPADRYKADVKGEIEAVDGVLKITRIAVHYTLKTPSDKHGDARACFETYLPGCPAAQSVIGCIDIRHTLDLSQ